VKLRGHLDGFIQKSIARWNKGVVPYSEFAEFFRSGKQQFAVGEMWGKAVRSACLYYRYTQDPELKRIAADAVAGALALQRPNGSISCAPPERQPDGPDGDLWERKYVMLAMEDYCEWVEPDPRALESLVRQADCIMDQIGPPPKTSITDQGWSATGIESSTLLEPFVRLWRMTGESRFLDFARYIVYNGASKGTNLFLQALDGAPPKEMGLPYQKAYEMTSVFEGLVEYYRAAGDPKWKEAALNYFRSVGEQEITIIGNGGGGANIGGECWSGMAQNQSDPSIQRMMETCVGVTWMKYCGQILRLTGSASAADAIERYAYNGLVGAMKPAGDGFSYISLLNGQKTINEGWGWQFGELFVSCCNLSGPIGLAHIPCVAIMASREGPVVNLYEAAEARMAAPAGGPLALAVETDFPRSGSVAIRVEPEAKQRFTLRLRIPAWSERTAVKVNGVECAAQAGAYLALDREWSPGDAVEIGLDMRCRALESPHGENRGGDGRQAVLYGPVVLARDESLDPAFDRPTGGVAMDEAGYVAAERARLAGLADGGGGGDGGGGRLAFTVPAGNGAFVMADYASADCWQGSRICTWMPK
jgi:DUF1680 family protein